MKNLVYILLLSLSFTACEVIVDLDIPKHEPVLVLNSVVKADSVFNVRLSRSVGSFDVDRNKEVNDAIISVFQDDVFLGEMSTAFVGMSHNYYYNEAGEYVQGDSVFEYILNEMPLPGANYTFMVSHYLYEDVQANTELEQKVTIDFIEIAKVDNEYSENYKLNFTFFDLPGEHYYRLRIINKVNQFDYEYIDPAFFETSDPSILSSSVVESSDPDDVGAFLHDALFTDEFFEGDEKTISLEFFDWSYSDFDTSSKFYLELSSISKDYFNYLHSYQRQSNYYGGELFAGEPVQVFTNVQNGLGILGASNTNSIKLNLPD